MVKSRTLKNGTYFNHYKSLASIGQKAQDLAKLCEHTQVSKE